MSLAGAEDGVPVSGEFRIARAVFLLVVKIRRLDSTRSAQACLRNFFERYPTFCQKVGHPSKNPSKDSVLRGRPRNKWESFKEISFHQPTGIDCRPFQEYCFFSTQRSRALE